MALDTRTQIAHLLRRAGFGASKQELDEYIALGRDGAVERLIEYQNVEDDVDQRVPLPEIDFSSRGMAELQRWWLLRMAYTKRPLQEKLVLMWHGWLTTEARAVNNAVLIYRQNQFFREHALDSFDVILKGITIDPAMLIYLDNRSNRRGRPNENYAREIMELFAMGEGNGYTEQDIREGARALTGWTVTRQGEAQFNRNLFDPDEKKIFGQVGRWGWEDFVDMIVRRPETGPFVARKLWSFFAYDDPEPEIIHSLARLYYTSGFSIKAMVHWILNSDAFSSEKAYRAKLKSPAELVAGALRSLEITTQGRNLNNLMARMGMQLFNPPNVAGWKGGRAWITSTTLLERLNFGLAVATLRNNASQTEQFDLMGLLRANDLQTPSAVLDHFLDLLVDGNVSPERRELLRDYLESDPPNGRLVLDQRFVEERVRGLLHLVLAMPEYQLA